MLIVNDAHLCPGWADRAWRSGVTPARSRLSAYPLVMSDDAMQTVYHVTCALDQATDLDLNSGWVG